jgi:hypothetical protein
MRTPALAFVACFLAAACSSDATAPSTASLKSVYLLSTINGAPLPCCTQLPAGDRQERWGTSEIDFTGPDTYMWKAALLLQWKSGRFSSTEIINRVVSAGRYSRSGSLLLFSDSATSQSFDALVRNDTITVAYRDTAFSFGPKPPPSLYESLWAELSCDDLTGGDPGCPATDNSGVVRTVLGGGGLQFDYSVADGHYAWETRYEYRHPDGSADTVLASTTGTYTWDGTTLSMVDGSTGEMLTGRLAKPLQMFLESGSHVYEFHRFIGPPTPDRAPVTAPAPPPTPAPPRTDPAASTAPGR